MDFFVSMGAVLACDGLKFSVLDPNVCDTISARTTTGLFVVAVWSAIALYSLWRVLKSDKAAG